MQDGDVLETWADIGELEALCPHQPWVSVEDGVKNFVNWYREFYQKDTDPIAVSLPSKN